MNPAKRTRLREIPGLLKALASEAQELLEGDDYLANTSQWRNDLSAAIARLEQVISEQIEVEVSLFSLIREQDSQTER